MNPVLSMDTAKSLVRWGGRYGIARAVIKAGARRGDLHGRLATDPRIRAYPYALYDEVRSRGDLVPGKFAMMTARHAVAAEILRHEDFGVGFPQEAMAGPIGRAVRWAHDDAVTGPVEPPSMLATDGADHARYRRLVSKAFTARAVEALGADVERIAEDLLGRMASAPDGRVDLVAGYAAALPVQVIAGVLGVPLHMQQTFLRWGADLTPSLDVDMRYRAFRKSERALRELNTWLGTHFARLRREPGDDLLSRVILAGRAEDEPELTDIELAAVAGLVLTAGFETTVNLIGNAVVLLLAHPEQLEILRADPTGWRNAVEETLRHDSPVQNTARHATREVQVRGQMLARFQLVVVMLAAANRDPAVFADPARYDVTRSNARDHLAFSAGAHYCLGAALARLEGEIALRMLFDRYPHLGLTAAPQRRPTRILRGWQHLPVRLQSAVPVP
jgi:cytochrome P450